MFRTEDTKLVVVIRRRRFVTVRSRRQADVMSKQRLMARHGTRPGHAKTLTPPAEVEGNSRNVKHGVRSKNGRALAPRAAEIADELMSLPLPSRSTCSQPVRSGR